MKILLLKWKLRYSETTLTLIKVQIYMNNRIEKTCLARNCRFAILPCAHFCPLALLSSRFSPRVFVLRAKFAAQVLRSSTKLRLFLLCRKTHYEEQPPRLFKQSIILKH